MKFSIYRPSIRTVKTGLAVAVSLAIANFFHLEAPFLSGISALMTVNDSISSSFKIALFRMTATVLGAVIACLFQFAGFTNSFAIGLAIVLLVQLFILLKWQESIITAGIVTISIMLFNPASHEAYILFSVSKIIDTFVGVATGFLINYLILPPRREVILVEYYRSILQEFIKKLGELLEKEGDVHISPLIAELNSITNETLTIEEDKRFIQNRVKETEIWEINTLFYILFSLITQLIDKKHIVPLTDKNKKALEELLDRDIQQRYDDKDKDYEKIFNFTISRIISTSRSIEKRLKEIESSVK
ncbi:MAG: hypothetical protein GX985_03620 [Gallicola sp.]|uniref:FUSC family protein n=1 Tax=Gallicola sp. Sow4_E12 TaxID=3438785 RepID=UPI001828CCF0|nr:hypothetical protein [Gallicola sp.]